MSVKKQIGFTLIELMMVVAIVAIISVFAVPAYNEQADRGRRAEGKAYLLELASRQERFYTQYSSYANLITASSCTGSACGLGMSDGYSPDKRYTGSLTVLPDGCSPTGTLCVSYTLTATSVAPDSKCAKLTYNYAGRKGVDGVTDQDLIDYCWR